MPYPSSNPIGRSYSLCATTGLLTAIATGTGAAGHLFAFRWGSTTVRCYLQNFKAFWLTTVGFTAAQEIGLEAFIVRSYSASHAGGTDILTAPIGDKRHVLQKASALTSARISTTAALTNGTETFDTNPIAKGGALELADGAGVYKGAFVIERDFVKQGGAPLILAANEGIVLRNALLMNDAVSRARVVVTAEWVEEG